MVDTTETLEPIVGNSPKELPVPQFNADEVCKVVQEGIDHAKIQLPAAESGTKLYKHEISYGGDVIIIVNNSPTQLALNNTPILDAIKTFGGSFNNGALIVRCTFIGSGCRYYYYDTTDTPSINYKDISNAGTDTVTEL